MEKAVAGLIDTVCSYLAVSGRDIRMLSMRDPGVARPNFTPLSYTKLNSTYLRNTKRVWLPAEHLYQYDILLDTSIKSHNYLILPYYYKKIFI